MASEQRSGEASKEPQHIKSAPKTVKVPSEEVISANWDKAIENFVYNVSIGTLVGGVTSLVLARGRGGRSAITGFGAGCGAGASYAQSKALFIRKSAEKK